MPETTLDWKAGDDSDLPAQVALTCTKWLETRSRTGPDRRWSNSPAPQDGIIQVRRRRVGSWLEDIASERR